MNEIQLSDRVITLMKNISKLAKTKKDLEVEDKVMRAELLKICEEHGIESIDNEFVKITKCKGSETTTVDLKKMEKVEPELYSELLADYPKTIIKKPYIRIVAK